MVSTKKKIVITRYSKLSDVVESRRSIGMKKRVGEQKKTTSQKEQEKSAGMALERNKQAQIATYETKGATEVLHVLT